MVSILDTEKTVTTGFKCGSNMDYTAKLYCFSTSNHFYKMKSPFNFRTKDNGGKLVKITINYLKKFDDQKDNAKVNQILCKLVVVLGV